MTKIKNLKKTASNDLEIRNKHNEERSKNDLELPSQKPRLAEFIEASSLKEPATSNLDKKSRIGKIFDKVNFVWNSFKNSKVGKILFSNSLSYAVSFTGAAIALSGLFTPVSPIIIAVAAISAVSVGIKAVNETLKIHSLRKLHKENNLLVQNRNAKTAQDYILKLDPSLNNILKNELYTAQTEQKNLNKGKYNIKLEKLKSAGRVITNNISGPASIAENIIAGASGNVIAIVKAVGYGVLTTTSLITDGLNEKERNDIKAIFKLNINEECKKLDTPDYKNLKQLEESTKEQIIKTLAIKELITNKNYWKMKDFDKQNKFHEIKGRLKTEIKQEGIKKFLEKKGLNIDNNKGNYVKDFTKVLNPFYENPTKAQEYTNLTKAMEANSTFFEKTKNFVSKQKEDNKENKKSIKVKKSASLTHKRER